MHTLRTHNARFFEMIPVFAAARARVIAPDLFGFGKSDKHGEEAFCIFNRHRGTLAALIECLDLADIALVCRDYAALRPDASFEAGVRRFPNIAERALSAFDRAIFGSGQLETTRVLV